MRNENLIKRKPIPEIFVFLAILIFGVIYVFHTWMKFENERFENKLQIARSIEAALPKEDFKMLEAKPGDIDKPQYWILKNRLKALIRINPEARFAYLYTEQNGKIFFIADSEPEDSKDYSPPGQEYTEAKSEDKQPFRDGKDLITKSMSDRWGTWMSVLIPIKDEATGKVIAVFGMDFSVKSWDALILFEVIESSTLFVLLLVVLIISVRIRAKNRSLKSEITERKRVEVALNEALVKSESSDKLKTAFINNISHEIRTPLNGIIGFGQLITQPDITNEDKEQFYSQIIASSNRLISTISGYMDISLIASGNMEVKLKPFNLHLFLYHLYEHFEPLCTDNNLKLHLKIPGNTHEIFLHSDSELFEKVLTNLLDNAIKFTRQGEIVFGYAPKPGLLEFFVKDTGIGISKDALNLVFKNFVQEDLSNNRRYEGSGLGLTISHRLVQLLGGEIRVESEKGRGSTFFMTLPYKEIVNEMKI